MIVGTEELDMQELKAVFAEMADTIYASDDADTVYQALVNSATQLIPGCDRACLMLERHGRFVTVAATDEIAYAVDQAERDLGEGPCLDAITEEAFQFDPNLANGSPWPRLAERLLRTTPVRGMIGYRLLVDEAKVGALNIFSDHADALTEASADAGAVMASFASVAVMTAGARGEALQLRRGLESNREIGKAVGLLMAAHHVSQERAFEILKATSQQLNLKLAVVAAEIVSGQERQFERPTRSPA